MNRLAAASVLLAAGAAGCGGGGARIDLGNGETLVLSGRFEVRRCEDDVLPGLFGEAYADGVVRADDADNPGSAAVRCVSMPFADNAAFNRELLRSLAAAGWEEAGGAASAAGFRKKNARLSVVGVALPLGVNERVAQEAAFIFLTAADATAGTTLR